MKRWLITIAIFVLAGAVVNVAVAWGCAIAPSVEQTPIYMRQSDPERFFSPMYCRRAVGPGLEQIAFMGGGSSPRAIKVDTLREADVMLPYWLKVPASRGLGFHRVPLEIAAGWPLRSLGASCVEYDMRWTWGSRPMTRQRYSQLARVGVGVVRPPFWRDAIVLQDQSESGPFSARVLPLRPIVVGFTFDTIFYAAVLWLLILGPFASRRVIRVRRGRCPKCAYPMGEAMVCSECGKPLPGHAVAET